MTDRNEAGSLAALQPLKLGSIALRGWIGERYDLTWRHNLLALDWDGDFLKPFIEKNMGPGFYVGMGKTLDGLSCFAAHTREPRLLALRRRVLDTLVVSQETDGYLGTYPPACRISRLWDAHELAYLLLALAQDWERFSEDPSLRAAVRLGDYLLQRLAKPPLPTEYNAATGSELAYELTLLGLDRGLLALHRATGDARYIAFCLDRLKLADWDLPIVLGRHARLEGHAYAYMTRCLAQLDLAQILSNRRLRSSARRVVDFLARDHGLVVSGTVSKSECWHKDQDGAGELGETCATAYWIRLCGRLLQIEGAGRYGDFMERAIYNTLFAAQSPDGRRLRYYTPFEGPRTYWEQDTYCCPGNFRRIVAELPQLVCFLTPEGLLVNLYTASTTNLSLPSGNSAKVTQRTDYPNSGYIRLRFDLDCAEAFSVRLRIPSWNKSFRLTVAGEEQPPAVAQGFVEIQRQWQPGDEVILDLAMPWRLVRGVKKQAGRAALLHGPVVFCLNPEHNALTEEAVRQVQLAVPEDSAPVPDGRLRAGGVACRCGSRHDSPEPLLWTEFADPDGTATYFPAAPQACLEDDDLNCQRKR